MHRPPTEYRDGVGRRRHRLADAQQEDDERQQDGDLEVDLLAGLHRQEEAEERDEEDEETGRDEVDEVEQAAATHVDREGDVRVQLRAAGVPHLVPLCRDSVLLVHRPLLRNTCTVFHPVFPKLTVT